MRCHSSYISGLSFLFAHVTVINRSNHTFPAPLPSVGLWKVKYFIWQYTVNIWIIWIYDGIYDCCFFRRMIKCLLSTGWVAEWLSESWKPNILHEWIILPTWEKKVFSFSCYTRKTNKQKKKKKKKKRATFDNLFFCVFISDYIYLLQKTEWSLSEKIVKKSQNKRNKILLPQIFIYVLMKITKV